MLAQGLRLIVVFSPPLEWMHMPHHSSGTKWTCHEKSTEFLCVVIFFGIVVACLDRFSAGVCDV